MPHATVAAIITQAKKDDDQILLTRRNIEPFKGKWCLPGGHIDTYEAAQEAVIREVQEETGLEYTPRFYGYFDEIIPEKKIHHVVIVFVGSGQGVFRPQQDEVSEMGWFLISECQSFALAFKHNEIIDSYALDLRG